MVCEFWEWLWWLLEDDVDESSAEDGDTVVWGT
jgi:hypothetical protein